MFSDIESSESSHEALIMLFSRRFQGISPGLIQRAAWCVRCFANGRYPETLSQRHFMKVRRKESSF